MLVNHPAESGRTVVSIHAPRFWGAMPGYGMLIQFVPRFNPRSPFLGSDAQWLKKGASVLIVSIHAPRFWGAMLISCNYRKYRNKKAALREPLYSRANSILRDQMAGGKSALNQSDIASANLPENTRPLPVRARL